MQGGPRCHPGRGRQFFSLAKYSRDLKPVEMFFAELKQGRRATINLLTFHCPKTSLILLDS